MGGRRPSAPSLQPCPPASSAAQRRSPDAMATQNELLGAAPCKGKLSSSSKPQPHRASVQKLNTSCFHPRPSALHRAKRGWAAPGSLGPAALLGVSCTRITLHTGSPSWGSRIGSAKAVCAQAPAMPPEPARPLSAEVLSQWQPKTSFLELHPAKGNSPRAANHSPNAPPLRKAAQAVFAPGPALCIGRCGAGLPLAPWALLLCWGSPAPETHS